MQESQRPLDDVGPTFNVDNPVARGVVAAAAEDEDMVPCPFFFEDLNSLLSRADGEPTMFFYAVALSPRRKALAMFV